MKELIIEKLEEIEKVHNCRILLAVESGSRAWGFASPDSDYDVRFIYVRKKEDYLQLNPARDVIELPINDVLDINGWDLDKTLRLLFKSNPTVFEWFSSPIVYKKTSFADAFAPLLREYFLSKSGMFHYLSMANSNYREFLNGAEVKLKKYFYVLRPVLACKWILEYHSSPPMRFSDLMEAELPQKLRPTVCELLEIKRNAPEVRLIPRIPLLNNYLEESMEQLRMYAEAMPAEPHRGWEPLNQLFLQILREQES